MPVEANRLYLEALCQTAGRIVGHVLGVEPGMKDPPACFAVMLFTPGKGGWATYTSNAERSDMIRALREMADNLEKGRDHH